MRTNRTAPIVLFAILFLFFLQVLSDFIQSIYAFGLLVTAFTPQLVAVVLLFSPVALIFMRDTPRQGWLIGLGAVAVLGRLAEPLFDPRGRLVACGISVGAFMLLWPMILAFGSRYTDAEASSTRPAALGWPAAWGLLLAVMLSIFFRTAGSSLDISEVGMMQFIAWVLAASAGWFVWRYELRGEESEPPRTPEIAAVASLPRNDVSLSHEERREASLRRLEGSGRPSGSPLRREETSEVPQPSSTARTIGLCIGLASVIVMLYFALVSPAVIARWTEASYAGIVAVLVVAWTAFALGGASKWADWLLRQRLVIVWNVLFVLMLVLTIVPHQVAFPVRSYPLEPGSVSPLWQFPPYLMLLLSPVIFVDFFLFVRGLSEDTVSFRQWGTAFSLAALFLLVMVFLHVFTTIYDYAKPIGPLFRDRFWLVYLIAGLGLILPLLLVPANTFRVLSESQPEQFVLIAIAGLAVLSIAAMLLTNPKLPLQPSTGGNLHVMTYNIQQGFDKVGNAALPSQLDAIRHVQPDVLGLEESDTARIANGNVDAVRYFANNLGMYSYYGPPTTVGTFGIALLSKYPIQNPRTFYMYSTAEQTACIQAQIIANGKTYNVFVTHLGNGGPMIQLQNVLSQVDNLPNVILVGDFNFDPTTPQYALATKSLADAWLLRWPSGRQLTNGAEGRIDQIFVSLGTQVTEAEYVPNPSSDHPYLYVVIR